MTHLVGLTLALTLTSSILLPGGAHAEGPEVSQVLIVDVEPRNMDDYMAFVKRAQTLVKKLGLPGFRVLQATMAGDNTGSLAIVIENESLGALAANQAKVEASAEWEKLVGEIQQAGISRITSNSLWIDVTPE